MATPVCFDATEGQYAAIRRAAEAEEMSIAEYVKSVVLDAIDYGGDEDAGDGEL